MLETASLGRVNETLNGFKSSKIGYKQNILREAHLSEYYCEAAVKRIGLFLKVLMIQDWVQGHKSTKLANFYQALYHVVFLSITLTSKN